MRTLVTVFALVLAVGSGIAAPFPVVYGVPGGNLELPDPPQSLGYNLTEADFLPFRNFRYQGMIDLPGDTTGLRTVAALGMVHWTHRYQVARIRHQETGEGPMRGRSVN